MAAQSSRDAVKARFDLQQKTLARLQSDFARLVYLASTRNYNTGRYEHDGLAFHYTARIAEDILADAHREIFLNLAGSSLQSLTEELEQYISTEAVAPDDLFTTWDTLEAYNILVPLRQDALVVKMFRSNLKAALIIARESWKKTRSDLDQQSALQSPSLGQ